MLSNPYEQSPVNTSAASSRAAALAINVCHYGVCGILQVVECGQCHEPLQLARRLDEAFDKAFDAISEVSLLSQPGLTAILQYTAISLTEHPKTT